jgi:hypothetical protein
MTEAEYWAEFQTVQNEVALAIECFHAHQEINNYATEDPAVLRGFNEAAYFWITVRYSLLTTFFITLGRLFDTDGEAHSLGKLLRVTAEHPEYFSRDALAHRKRQSTGGGEPQWLAGFMKDTWQPETADLRALRRALSPWRKKYEAFYQPIRHEVFAHKALPDSAGVNALFSKAIIQEIEEVLSALHDLTSAIFHLYQNGTKPELGGRDYGYARRVEEINSTARRALSNIRREA